MLRVSRRVFRRVAQQLFRNHTRLFEFYLRLRLIALEEMNRSFEESLGHRRGRVSDQCLTGEFLHDGKGFGKFALQHQHPRSYPSHQTIRIDLGWNRRRLFFGYAKVTSPRSRQVCFQRKSSRTTEALRRSRDQQSCRPPRNCARPCNCKQG